MSNLFDPFLPPDVSLRPADKVEKALSETEQKWRRAILLEDVASLKKMIEHDEIIKRPTKKLNPWLLALSESSSDIRKLLIQAEVPIVERSMVLQAIVEQDCLASFHYFLQKLPQSAKTSPSASWSELLGKCVEHNALCVACEILVGDEFKKAIPQQNIKISSSYVFLTVTPHSSATGVSMSHGAWLSHHNSMVKLKDLSALLLKDPPSFVSMFKDVVKNNAPNEIKNLLNDRNFWTFDNTVLFEKAVSLSSQLQSCLKEVSSHTHKLLHVKMHKRFGTSLQKTSLHVTTKNFLEHQFLNGAPFFEEYVKTKEGLDAVTILSQNDVLFKEFLVHANPKTLIEVVKALNLTSWRDQQGNNPAHYMIFHNQGVQTVSAIIDFCPSWLGEENSAGRAPLTLLEGGVRIQAERAVIKETLPEKASSLSRKM